MMSLKFEAPHNHDTSMMYWKDAATGLHRWFAIYSNNYRDDDNPSEIISARSHQTFVELVNKGIVDYPELWLWHVPVAWGKADFVDYINGFAVAGGTVYPGYEFVAENLSKQRNLATSHGMPQSLIQYDAQDKSVITFHITKEISPLPAHRAANKRTGFVLLKGDVAMPLAQDKREFLVDKVGLPADFVKQLEDHMDAVAAEAAQSAIESKEQSPAEAVADPATEPAADADAAAPVEITGVTEEPLTTDGGAVILHNAKSNEGHEYATREEVAAVFAEVIAPLIASQNQLATTLQTLTKEMSELRGVQTANADRLKEVTPPLSLKEILARNLIGSAAARVNDGDPLAGDKPKEAAPPVGAGPTLVPFINGILAGSANGH